VTGRAILVAESEVEITGYEKHDINVPKVIGISVLLIIILVGILIVLNDFFVSEKEKVVYETLLKPESNELLDLRATELDILNSYKTLDAEKGTYQIPIERAMQLLADEYSHQRHER
jgi:hypothetical protein